ncbi:uncharacterized protein LOC6561609 [Drosophila grimshawi]|uniref:GH11573 n=1 Tax=Drosophila grimshawi TaxID=7222 RepID=B4JBL2_DROGR|nr:uncharacterized protein LOC6561609 [Drosophila grimshawi]EDW04035.1 GH11573 [Drosophila grimshawi]
MSWLSTLLIPQQHQTKNAQILARICEQRYGSNWIHYMKCNRNISLNSAVIAEQRATTPTIVRCVNPTGSSLQTPRSTRSLKELDYRIYPQSIDLDAFFGAEQKCEKVSDICLLNDHFILVKMPEDEPAPPAPHAPPVAVPRKLGSRLPRCFKCNRGSRVSPILEELEEPEPNGYNPWSSHADDDADADANDDDDVEVFASRTRIISAKTKTKSVILEKPQQQLQLQQRSPPVASLQLETLQYSPPSTADPYPISRGPLHWFLWPFRRRSKTQQQQQLAAVHKTYFIRWNKPPDTLFHGYGVEHRPVQPNKVGLRRCRSAIF